MPWTGIEPRPQDLQSCALPMSYQGLHPTRLEPVTSRLSGMRSNLLSWGANKLPRDLDCDLGLQDRRLTAWPRKLQFYYLVSLSGFIKQKKGSKKRAFWVFCFIIFIGFCVVLWFLLGFVFYHFYWVFIRRRGECEESEACGWVRGIVWWARGVVWWARGIVWWVRGVGRRLRCVCRRLRLSIHLETHTLRLWNRGHLEATSSFQYSRFRTMMPWSTRATVKRLLCDTQDTLSRLFDVTLKETTHRESEGLSVPFRNLIHVHVSVLVFRNVEPLEPSTIPTSSGAINTRRS